MYLSALGNDIKGKIIYVNIIIYVNSTVYINNFIILEFWWGLTDVVLIDDVPLSANVTTPYWTKKR